MSHASTILSSCNRKSSATLPPAASASPISSSTFNSSGRLSFSHSAPRLSLTSRRSSPHSQHLIIANQLLQPLSAVVGVPSCRPSPDAAASQPLQLSDKPHFSRMSLCDFELAKHELLKPANLFLKLRAISLRPQFSSADILASLLLDARSQGLGTARRGLHGFHRIHIPPVTCWSSKNSSDADRSCLFTNDHDVFICCGCQYQPSSRTPNSLQRQQLLGFCNPSRVWPPPARRSPGQSWRCSCIHSEVRC